MKKMNTYIKCLLQDLGYGIIFYMLLRVNWRQEEIFDSQYALILIFSTFSLYALADIVLKICLDKRIEQIQNKEDFSNLFAQANERFYYVSFVVIFIVLIPVCVGIMRALGKDGIPGNDSIIVADAIGLFISIAGTYIYYHKKCYKKKK